MNIPHIYFGCDHGGLLMKHILIRSLADEGVELNDLGTHGIESVDYPEYAVRVAQRVASDPESIGILLCRSGEGMEMAANKIRGVRAALVWNVQVAAETRHDNDANILVLPADFLPAATAVAIMRRFIATPFSRLPRHQQRIEELTSIEELSYAI